jgi:hypothetical protein
VRDVLQQPPLRAQQRLDTIRHAIERAGDVTDLVGAGRRAAHREVPTAEALDRLP